LFMLKTGQNMQVDKINPFIEPPIRPAMKADESAIGYLLRLKNENGYGHLSRLSRNGAAPAGSLPYISSIVETQDWDPVQVDKLSAEYVNLPASLTTQNVQVCAKCLEEDGYWRASWHALHSGVCHKHKLRLKSACDRCGKPISFKQKHLLECNCGRKYADMKYEHASEEELKLISYINGSNDLTAELGISCSEPSTLMSRLRFISRLTKMLSQYAAKDISQETKTDFPQQNLLRNCAEILFGDKRHFENFIYKLVSSGKDRLDESSFNSTRKNRLKTLFNVLFDGEAGYHIVYLDEILERKEINSNRLRTNSIRLKKLLSSIEKSTAYLAELFNLPEQFLLDNGLNQSILDPNSTSRCDLYEAQELARFYRNTLSLDDAASRLSIPLQNFARLVAVNAFKKTQIEGLKSSQSRVKKADIQEFESKVPIKISNADGYCSIDSLVKDYGHHFHEPYIALYIALIRGKVKACRHVTKGNIGYYYDFSSFNHWLMLTQNRAPGLNLDTVAEYLDVKLSTLRELIELQIMPVSLYGKECYQHIKDSQMHIFKSKYILSNQLSKQTGKTKFWLHKHFDAQCLYAEREFEGGSVRVYRRQDVEKALPYSTTGSVVVLKAIDEYFTCPFRKKYNEYERIRAKCRAATTL